jgi:hypothetical protein
VLEKKSILNLLNKEEKMKPLNLELIAELDQVVEQMNAVKDAAVEKLMKSVRSHMQSEFGRNWEVVVAKGYIRANGSTWNFTNGISLSAVAESFCEDYVEPAVAEMMKDHRVSIGLDEDEEEEALVLLSYGERFSSVKDFINDLDGFVDSGFDQDETVENLMSELDKYMRQDYFDEGDLALAVAAAS